MRVAVLADIHGNLPALEAVMEDIKRQAPDYIVAAGDLSLRGAYPAECADLVFDTCHSVLMGNTDCYISGAYLGGAYRERDHWKTELLSWTREQLGPARVAKLAQLAFSVRYTPRKGQDLFVCHANPRNLEDSLEPTLDEATLKRFLSHLDATAVAFGHLHFPYRRRLGRMVIADVASAGIPRDGDLRPAWGLFTFTPRGWRVQIRRVRYAVRKATQSLIDRKVPGAPLLIHKMLEARYKHHHVLSDAARRHSGLPPAHPPYLKPPPGAPLALKPVGEVVPPPRPSALPPPGQATQADEAADELTPLTALPPPSELSREMAPTSQDGDDGLAEDGELHSSTPDGEPELLEDQTADAGQCAVAVEAAKPDGV